MRLRLKRSVETRLKRKKKNTKSRRDEDENIQSKNEFKAPKLKANRLKIDVAFLTLQMLNFDFL